MRRLSGLCDSRCCPAVCTNTSYSGISSPSKRPTLTSLIEHVAVPKPPSEASVGHGAASITWVDPPRRASAGCPFNSKTGVSIFKVRGTCSVAAGVVERCSGIPHLGKGGARLPGFCGVDGPDTNVYRRRCNCPGKKPGCFGALAPEWAHGRPVPEEGRPSIICTMRCADSTLRRAPTS